MRTHAWLLNGLEHSMPEQPQQPTYDSAGIQTRNTWFTLVKSVMFAYDA